MTNSRWYSPLLVSLGALLWATDTFFRSDLASRFSPLLIVTTTHLICLPITLPLLISQRKHLAKMNKTHWLALLFIALGGSCIAMIFFTQAFATTSNYNIPILLQKLQPIIGIALAALLLKEKISARFLVLSLFAIFGAYLVSMGDVYALNLISEARAQTIWYTLGAAVIWGGCTVASRHLLSAIPFWFATSCRYVLATFVLLFALFISGDLHQLGTLNFATLKLFMGMALIPGLLALMIYYSGMQGTKASTATLCELAFPVGAVFINWIFLSSKLNHQQIVGALLLVSAVTWINIRKAYRRHAQ